ncbi:MAG TPA: SAM-dependent methyltransferase, partial [Actinomycetota bacterium]|nr:SAM-dependent methyltransferase [Actinomycetota bacterium]
MSELLAAEIRHRIAESGPLPFEAFMRLALYHPEHGYYATRVPGEGGHYGTSPSVSPWFGRLVAGELEGMWRALGQPASFTVIEVGAGRADLAASALAGAGDPFSAALHWRIVEQFAAVAALQARRLGAQASRVVWSSRLGDAAVGSGCVLAHEVLDNFPVHVLEESPSTPGAAQEVYVALDGSHFVERLCPPSDRRLVAGQGLVEGQAGRRRRFEVCSGLEAWLAEASAAIERGYLLLIDYGDLEDDLWAKNPEGTIVTYGPDGFGRDPLAEPGERDITADVNFSAVER